MSMEGLRRGAQSINSGRGNRGPQRSSYYARWKPAVMNDQLKRVLAAPPSEESYLEVAEPIVIIRGEYPDHFARDEQGAPLVPPPNSEAFHYRSHTFPIFVQPKNGGQGFKSFREIICSAGSDPHVPQPCVGCHQVDHGAKDSRSRDKWSFNIAHLGWYHSHPLVKDGQIQYKRGSQEPVMIKDECLSYKMENVLLGRAAQAGIQMKKRVKACESCNQQHPYIFGDHRVIEVGFRYLKTILDLDDELGKKCANCGTFLIRVAFDCGSCGQEILDIAQAGSGWTNEQLDQYSKTPTQCPSCQQVGTPKTVYDCGYDERYQKSGGGCPDEVEPKKTSIFDCVLWLQREGQAMESEIVVKKVELISQYQMPQLPDGRVMTLPEYLNELVKTPFNLTEMYAPATLDEQAEEIRIPNPYAQQQQQYQPYPGQQAPQGYGQPGQQPGYGQQPQQGFTPPGAPGGFSSPGVPQQQPQAGQPQQGQAGPMYPNMPVPGRPNFGK